MDTSNSIVSNSNNFVYVVHLMSQASRISPVDYCYMYIVSFLLRNPPFFFREMELVIVGFFMCPIETKIVFFVPTVNETYARIDNPEILYFIYLVCLRKAQHAS